MVVNELRTAVIDTINFIIPPFVKLIIMVLTASYVTYGHLTDYYFQQLLALIKNVKIDIIKEIIEKLYLTGIVPVLFILILIAIAYLINRIIVFVSSLIPFSFSSSNQLANHYSVQNIWKYFENINNIYDLELRLNQIFNTIKAEDDATNFESLEYHKQKIKTEFSYYNFIQFSFIFSLVCFFITRNTLNHSIEKAHLFVALAFLLIAATLILARIANCFFSIQQNKLMILENHLKKEKGFLPNYFEIDRKILEKINSAKTHSLKWWWISFGYKLGWLQMFKFYNLRYPFYNYFQNRRFRDNLRK